MNKFDEGKQLGPKNRTEQPYLADLLSFISPKLLDFLRGVEPAIDAWFMQPDALMDAREVEQFKQLGAQLSGLLERGAIDKDEAHIALEKFRVALLEFRYAKKVSGLNQTKREKEPVDLNKLVEEALGSLKPW